jgi:hypothetical protein
MTLRRDSSPEHAHAHAHAHAAASLLRARRIVLCLLLALGCCTIITAMLLMLQTLNDSNVTYLRISKQQQLQSWTRRAAANGKVPTGGRLVETHVSREQDPDWVNSIAANVKFALKKCAPGCEVRGNCNVEEGR